MGRHDHAGGGAHAGELLHGHNVHLVGATLAAVFHGDGDTHNADLGHLLHGFHREALLFIDLSRQRFDLVLGEFANHLQEKFFSFV